MYEDKNVFGDIKASVKIAFILPILIIIGNIAGAVAELGSFDLFKESCKCVNYASSFCRDVAMSTSSSIGMGLLGFYVSHYIYHQDNGVDDSWRMLLIVTTIIPFLLYAALVISPLLLHGVTLRDFCIVLMFISIINLYAAFVAFKMHL